MDFRIRDIWEAYWNGFIGGGIFGVTVILIIIILVEKLT